jgi:hypothetical protein
VKIRGECRFVVVGLDVPLAGACSLLLAMRQGRRFIYLGRVEWGATNAFIPRIRKRCTVLTSPMCEGAGCSRGAAWIRPDFMTEFT